ncbi:hypothetical protein [Noviherbaspirillum sedimenti]|uniref:Uncharacterized protein n=1 Tax=Noviherbaspirillum sedimenti TaxID=2320865 RepID=A0A3A3G2E7_9BURK|nr:hypothetical protein [Noviherbaspirillum sedimenti]RJG02637.1 hypothetical protein D3878_14510 [Noviherbaspirillum sedimenti]
MTPSTWVADITLFPTGIISIDEERLKIASLKNLLEVLIFPCGLYDRLKFFTFDESGFTWLRLNLPAPIQQELRLAADEDKWLHGQYVEDLMEREKQQIRRSLFGSMELAGKFLYRTNPGNIIKQIDQSAYDAVERKKLRAIHAACSMFPKRKIFFRDSAGNHTLEFEQFRRFATNPVTIAISAKVLQVGRNHADLINVVSIEGGRLSGDKNGKKRMRWNFQRFPELGEILYSHVKNGEKIDLKVRETRCALTLGLVQLEFNSRMED